MGKKIYTDFVQVYFMKTYIGNDMKGTESDIYFTQDNQSTFTKGARDIIRGCHNRDKGTAENERLRDQKFIFSYPENERLIFLNGKNAAQEEISTMRVG